jgi:two-component system LytT family response regulator
LVNRKHIKRYIKGEGGEVVMCDGSNLPVSRRQKAELMEALGRL